MLIIKKGTTQNINKPICTLMPCLKEDLRPCDRYGYCSLMPKNPDR